MTRDEYQNLSQNNDTKSYRRTSRSKIDHEIQKFSKIIVFKVNKVARLSAKLNKWKVTRIVIEWFRKIKTKGEKVISSL